MLERIEQQQEVDAMVPDNVKALELLQLAYRGKVKLSSQQARCAIEALPYEMPKLSASAIVTTDGKSFAEALERAVERSAQVYLPRPPVIDATPELPPSVANKRFASYRRFARR